MKMRSLTVAIVLATLIVGVCFSRPSGPAAAQEQNVDFTGRGKNMAFTLIETKPEFWRNNYEVLRKRYPKLYVRRVVTDKHDEFLMMVLLTNADIIEFLGEIIYQVDLLDGVLTTSTRMASVDYQRQPLTIEEWPRTGYVIAKPRETRVMSERLEGSLRAVRSMGDVLLVSTAWRRGIEVIIVYDLKTTDAAAHNKFMITLEDALMRNGLVITEEGICPPVGSRGN